MNSRYERQLHDLQVSGRITPEQREEIESLVQATTPKRLPGVAALGGHAGKMILAACLSLFVAVVLAFTPYTHQLDELKTMLLYLFPPLMLLAALRDFDRTALFRRSSLPMLLLCFFGLWCCVSYIANFTYWRIGEPVLLTQLGFLALAWLVAWYAADNARLRTTAHVLTGVALTTALIGLALYCSPMPEYLYELARQRFPLWSSLFYTLSASHQMYSTVLNSSFYADFIIGLLPLILAVLITAHRKLTLATAAVAFVLSAICLYLTKSTPAFVVATLVVLPAFLWVGWLRLDHVDGGAAARRRLLKFAAPLVGMLVAALLIGVFRPSDSTEDSASRGILWSGAVKVWLYGGHPASPHSLNWHSFLLGNGPAGFRLHFPEYRQPDFFKHGINNVTAQAHNMLADFLCNYGLIGTALFVGFLVCTGWLGISLLSRTKSPERLLLGLGALCGAAGLLLLSLWSPSTLWPVPGATMWILLGLSVASVRLEFAVPDSTSRAPESSSAFRLVTIRPVLANAMAGGFVILFVLCGVPFGANYFKAAVENSDGLRCMEISDTQTGVAREQSLRLARDHFLQAITLNPSFATSYYKLAHVQNSLGKNDEAIETYEQLQRLDPNYAEVHMNLAVVYRTKGEATSDRREKRQALERAATEARIAARQSVRPETLNTAASTLRELGVDYSTQGDMEAAGRAYSEAAALYRTLLDNPPTHSDDRRGSWKELARAARQALTEIHAQASGDMRDEETVLSPGP